MDVFVLCLCSIRMDLVPLVCRLWVAFVSTFFVVISEFSFFMPPPTPKSTSSIRWPSIDCRELEIEHYRNQSYLFMSPNIAIQPLEIESPITGHPCAPTFHCLRKEQRAARESDTLKFDFPVHTTPLEPSTSFRRKFICRNSGGEHAGRTKWRCGGLGRRL